MKNLDDFMYAILFIIYSVNLTFKVVSFKWNQARILEIVENLREIEEKFDSQKTNTVNLKIKNTIKVLLIFEIVAGTIMGIAIVLLSSDNRFVIPLLYKANGDAGYYTIFIFHYLQVYAIGTSYVGVESMFIVTMLLLENYITFLNEMVAKATEPMKNIIDIQNKLNR